MNKSLLILSLVLLHSGNQIFAQSDTRESNSRYVLTLNDRHVESLRSLGSVQSRELDADVQGEIAVIQIQFSESATDQAVIAEAETDVQGNACQILLNDSLIELARQQPIRINVPANSTFGRVFLRYENQTVPPTDPNSAPQSIPDITGGLDLFAGHYVTLAGNQTLSGQIDLSNTIKFDTKFGEIDISIGQIEGLRFHVDGEDSAIIVLKNGDSITGKPQFNAIELTTDWGRAELETVFVESITTSSQAIFQQNSSGVGPRWQLIGN